MRSKKGEKLLSIWWFVTLALVGVAIVAGVLMYFSGDIEIKQIEAGILSQKVVNCVVRHGFLVEDIFNENPDILKLCSLNPKVFENGNFYFKISAFDEGNKEIRAPLKFGDFSLEKDCFENKILSKSYPKCVLSRVEVSYLKDGVKKGRIEVLGVSDSNGEKL